jgi:lipopolysaccharide export system protein LptA
MIRWWITCTALLLATTAAAAPLESGSASREPVEVTSDSLEADDVAKTVIFIGHAVAKQGDVTIHGDRLTIHSAAGGNDVERMIAEGNVRIVQGQRTATGDRAEYLRAEERIVLTGSPRVSEGQNSVQGHEIVLFLKENRSVVKGGADGRVNAVFQPQSGGVR